MKYLSSLPSLGIVLAIVSALFGFVVKLWILTVQGSLLMYSKLFSNYRPLLILEGRPIIIIAMRYPLWTRADFSMGINCSLFWPQRNPNFLIMTRYYWPFKAHKSKFTSHTGEKFHGLKDITQMHNKLI